MPVHARPASRLRLLVATVLAVLVTGTLAAGTPATAAGTTVVKGAIAAAGEWQPGVKVRLMLRDPDSGDSYATIASTTTGTRGAFSFSGFPVITDGRYELWYDDPDRDLVSGWRLVDPVRGSTVTRNITARLGSVITGTVRYANGAQPTHARVLVDGQVADADGPTRGTADPEPVWPTEVAVGADGRFTVKGLPRGGYRLTFTDTTHYFYDVCHDGSRERVDESGAPTCQHVPRLAVGIGTRTTLPAVTFTDRSAQVIGRVTNASGASVGSFVTLHREGDPAVYAATNTQSGAVWRIIDLPAGRWQVKVDPYDARYATRWYTAATSQSGATVVTTATGQKVVNRNVVVPLR
jgi:hypothetical protein